MIAVITDPGVGGTFLTWTINYLSGETKYFSLTEQTFVDLPDTPLTNKNAHNFCAMHPNNISGLENCLSRTMGNNECVYIHQFRDNTQLAVDLVCSNASKILVVAMPNSQALYNCRYQSRGDASPAWSRDSMLTNPDEIYRDFISYFYAESNQTWMNENLNNIWDQREFMALNFDSARRNEIVSYVRPETEYYHIDTMDLWNTFNSSVRNVFGYLNLSIDETRYPQWELVYQQWKQLHTDNVRFVWYFDIIVNAILSGANMDLSRFKLDISQEAAIQRELIYKHNLNLKTWKLEKFLNTKQLHNLLEPNIHDLTKSINR